MSLADDIKQLFESVYESEKDTFEVQEWSIKQSVRNIGLGYRPNPKWVKNTKSITPSYDEPSQRCAYLLKYAMLHTAMVYDLLDQASWIYRVKSTIEAKQALNLCSFGSGPGTDIVALLFFLRDHFEFKQCQASLVDQSIGWRVVFESIVSKLKGTRYNVREMVSEENFSFKYLKADLLNFSDRRVVETIKNADIITMVKFISAAACKDTSKMLKKIFKAMKRGALLLFIDNAAGGFCEVLEENANLYDLKSVFESEKHYKYEEPKFNIVKLGITSQYQTTVVAEMWMKESSSQNDEWDEADYVVAHSDLDVCDEIEYSVSHSSYDDWSGIDYAVPYMAHSDYYGCNEIDYAVAYSDSDESDEIAYGVAHSDSVESDETDYTVSYSDSDERNETDYAVAHSDSDESGEIDYAVTHSDSDERNETDYAVAYNSDPDENDKIDYAAAHSDSDESDETDYVVAHSDFGGCDEIDYAVTHSGYDEWGEIDYTVAQSDSDEWYE